MPSSEQDYMPAAGLDWLLPLYDPFTRLLGIETIHRLLIDQAQIRPGCRVLEIGCGTGNLAILAKRLHPEADIVGIDPDPRAIHLARRKALRHGVAVKFDMGFAQQLADPDASYDRVLSAFMFHHVKADEKEPTLLEARRVLDRTGSLHLVDFAGARDASSGLFSHLLYHIGRSRLKAGDVVLPLLRMTGFVEHHEVAHRDVLLGRLAFYRAAAWVPAA